MEDGMPLSGSQFKQLQEALLSAFPTQSELAQMVQFGLNQNLDAIAGTGRLADVVFQLIRWAEAQSRTVELVTIARDVNPGNLALRAFAEGFLNQTSSRHEKPKKQPSANISTDMTAPSSIQS